MSTEEQRFLSYNLFYVQSNAIDLYWGSLNFKEALSHTHMTTEDLRDSLKKGYCDLYIAKGPDMTIYGGLVVKVFDGFGGRVLEVIAAQGERMDKWFNALWAQVEKVAKACQCQRILIIGRKGWERQMKQFDFKQTAIVLEKVLDG